MIEQLNGTLVLHGRRYHVAARRRAGPNGEHTAIVTRGTYTKRLTLPRRLRFGSGIITAAAVAMEAMGGT